jgi:hypothetical protein
MVIRVGGREAGVEGARMPSADGIVAPEKGAAPVFDRTGTRWCREIKTPKSGLSELGVQGIR